MTETATAERSTVDTGPVDQLADWLVRFLVVFITMRIPGSLFVAAACSVLLLMILPLRSPRSQALPWLNTMVTATVASSIGVLTVARSPEVINFATITIVCLLGQKAWQCFMTFFQFFGFFLTDTAQHLNGVT